MSNWDTSLFLLINDGPHPAWLDALMAVLSAAGTAGLIFWVGLGIAFLGARGSARFTATLGLATLLLTVLLGEGLLKGIVQRPRPWAVLPWDSLHHLGPLPHTSSFPSVHTMAAFAVAVVVGCRHPRWRWPLLVLAALMGYSRVYAGDHFPLDVLGGAGAGVLLALGVVGGMKVVVSRLREEGTGSAPPASSPVERVERTSRPGDSPDLRIISLGVTGMKPGEALADRPVPIYTVRQESRRHPPGTDPGSEVVEPIEVYLPRRNRCPNGATGPN